MAINCNLLIVDDCIEDRKIYSRYLLKAPDRVYQILEVSLAEDGLALCQDLNFDAILLDFCLPDMTGLEFLDRLKDSQVNAPAIFLTGHGDEEIAVRAMKMGAQDYLIKQNLQPDILQMAVRNAIERSRLQAQLNKTKERQRLIATTALRIRQSLNLQEILNTAVAEVKELLKCDRVVVYQFLESQQSKIVAEVNSNLNYFPRELGFDRDLLISASSNHHNFYCKSLEETLNFQETDWGYLSIEKFNKSNTQANLFSPIILSNEDRPKIWGLLIAQQSLKERKWQPDEAEMLNEVSVQLAIAIQQAELLAQTQAALEKEKQLNAFKSQIVGTVAHEYRTPLASILAAASTLQIHRDNLDEKKRTRFLQIIEEKSRHMAKLIDDTLLVNQIELNKAKFKPIPLDLLQFFAELLDEQSLILNKKHQFLFKVTGNLKGFWGDRGLLRQIFVNLMSNAIKYSPNGGKIDVKLIGKNSEVIFYIKDEGIGIPSEDKDLLFQSFHRGSNVDTIPGTGLGLVIVKACIELHNGKIAIDSQLGIGTKVKVILPKRKLE
jgi:signal transduction histidine kinase/FixJ family two-component response regulator